jgi:hypothetical protein
MAQPVSLLYYFIGPLNTETQGVMDELKKRDEFCVQTVSHEEIDQGVKQIGKVVLIFSDIKFTIEFIKGLNTADSKQKKILIIDKNGSFKPPVMKFLADSKITFRTPKDRNDIYIDIQNFIEEKDAPIDELVFNANTED